MSQSPVPQHDLFISYADADRAWVEGYLLDSLTAAGVDVYSEAAFALGAPRLTQFEQAVKTSHRTLLVLSPAFVADQIGSYVEILTQSYGIETKTWPVIPLILQPVELPMRLAMLHSLDATDPADWEQVIARLCAELNTPVPAATVAPPCPYPGMRPFSTEQSHAFFGRDAEIADAVDRLRRHPFLTVIGPSGSGKSSLVFAGVIPALHKSTLFGADQWDVRTLRPGATPLTELARTIDLESASPVAAGTRRLLVIDQFEETFTQAGAEAAAFQQAILKLMKVDRLILILTVRADFYGDLMGSPLWESIQARRLEVTPLGNAQLRAVIVRPAQDVGVFVEATLVERLVADAADEPGILPLVQECLVLLWEKLVRRFLPLAAYETLLSPQGAAAATGLQVAMARHANDVYADLSQAGQAIARRIFLRLIQFGEGRPDTRRQQSVDDLRASGDDPHLFDQTLAHLIKNRLLTASGDVNSGTRRLDISHEALIKGWPQLQVWLGQRRTAEQTRRRLEVKAEEWVQAKKVGGLLDAYGLQEAANWLAGEHAGELGYSNDLAELVSASENALAYADAEKEAQRQRELDQANQLADAQRLRAEEGEQAAIGLRRRFRSAVAAALVAMIFLIATGIAAKLAIDAQGQAEIEAQRAVNAQATAVAERQRAEENAVEANRQKQEAEKAAHRAQADELAVHAQNSIVNNKDDPSLALLLAIQAVETTWRAPEHTVIINADAALRAAVDARKTLPRHSHTDWVRSAAYSPDGMHIVTASDDFTAHIWEMETGQEPHRLIGHNDWVLAAAYSPNGAQIVTASADGTARIWDVATCWDADTCAELRQLSGHTDSVLSAAYSPDGAQIVTASADGTARIWYAATGQELRQLSGHTDSVSSAAYSPDGVQIVTASGDGTARIWDATSGRELRQLSGHTEDVFSAAYSPDGAQIVTASWDRTVRIWDAASGQELLQLSGHSDTVLSAAYSPDGAQIVTASADRTARIWDAATGQELRQLSGHTGEVLWAAYSPDGRQIVTASADQTARIWLASIDELLAEAARLIQRDPAQLTSGERRRYGLE